MTAKTNIKDPKLIREEILEQLHQLHQERIKSKKFKSLSADFQLDSEKLMTQATQIIKELITEDPYCLLMFNMVFTAGRLAGVTYTLDQLENPTAEETPAKETSNNDP